MTAHHREQPKSFELDDALRFQEDLIGRFSSLEFQDNLLKLAQSFENKACPQARVSHVELCLAEQKPLLLKYGFEPSASGLSKIIRQCGRFWENTKIQKNSHEINRLVSLQ